MDYDTTVSSPEFASVMRDPSSLLSALAVLEEQSVSSPGGSKQIPTANHGEDHQSPQSKVAGGHLSARTALTDPSPPQSSSVPSAEHLFTPSDEDTAGTRPTEAKQMWADEVIQEADAGPEQPADKPDTANKENSVARADTTVQGPASTVQPPKSHRKVLSGDVKPFILKTGISMFPRSVLSASGLTESERAKSKAGIKVDMTPSVERGTQLAGDPTVKAHSSVPPPSSPTAQPPRTPKGPREKKTVRKGAKPQQVSLKHDYKDWMVRLEDSIKEPLTATQSAVPGAFFSSGESSTGSFASAKTQEITREDQASRLILNPGDIGAALSALSARVSDLEQAQARHERECAQELESLTKRIGGNWSGSSKSNQGVVVTGSQHRPTVLPEQVLVEESSRGTVESILRLALREAKGQPQRVLVSRSKQLITDLLSASNVSDFSAIPSSIESGLRVLQCQSLTDALIRVS